MSKRKGAASDVELLQRMSETMKELANRDYVHEAAMLRVARAGEVKDVIKHIMSNRKYLKTHTTGRARREAQAPANKAHKTRRKRAGQGEGEGTTHDTPES